MDAACTQALVPGERRRLDRAPRGPGHRPRRRAVAPPRLRPHRRRDRGTRHRHRDRAHEGRARAPREARDGRGQEVGRHRRRLDAGAVPARHRGSDRARPTTRDSGCRASTSGRRCAPGSIRCRRSRPAGRTRRAAAGAGSARTDPRRSATSRGGPDGHRPTAAPRSPRSTRSRSSSTTAPASCCPTMSRRCARPRRWVALLPGLDPTVMGWKERDWYLGPHAARLFDRNGNAGPTVWSDGRVVGGWGQRRDGVVEAELLEPVDDTASRAVARGRRAHRMARRHRRHPPVPHAVGEGDRDALTDGPSSAPCPRPAFGRRVTHSVTSGPNADRICRGRTRWEHRAARSRRRRGDRLWRTVGHGAARA